MARPNAQGGVSSAPPSLLVALGALLAGTLVWFVTILVARGSMQDIFGDLGVAIDGLRDLQRASAVAAGVLGPLLLALLAANTWLLTRSDGSSAGGPPGTTRAQRLAALSAANQVAVLVSAFMLAGTFAWFLNMKMIADAAGGAAPAPWWPPTAADDGTPFAPAPAPTAPTTASLISTAAPEPAGGGPRPGPPAPKACPSGCIDLGTLGPAFGLPVHCVCLPGFLARQLASSVGHAAGQLGAAVAAAAIVVAATSWLAAAAAVDLAAEGGAPEGWFFGAGGGGGEGDAVRQPLLPGPADGAGAAA